MGDIMEKLGLAQVADTLVGDLRTPGDLYDYFAVDYVSGGIVCRFYCICSAVLDIVSIFFDTSSYDISNV